MNKSTKIAIALLGLSAVGGLIYFITTRQSGAAGSTNSAGTNTLVVTESFAKYEGQYIKGTGREVYKVKSGKKEILPMVSWVTYAPRAIVIPDRILNSIPNA